MSAVHDGGRAAAASAAAEAAAGDSAGIALDAVRDVGGGHGWGCTQALPQQQLSSQQGCKVCSAFQEGLAIYMAQACIAIKLQESRGQGKPPWA